MNGSCSFVSNGVLNDCSVTKEYLKIILDKLQHTNKNAMYFNTFTSTRRRRKFQISI